MTLGQRDGPRPAWTTSRSRCRRGRTATPAPGSRCSARPGTPRTVQEKIADAAAGAPVHRAGADGGAAHPVGPGRRLRARCARTPRSSACALGTINSNTFQDDDYKLGCADPRRPADPREGDRPPPRVHRRHGRDRVAGPEDLAAPTAPTTRARATCAAGRTGWPSRWPQIYAALGDDQRLVLEYKFFEPAFYHTDVPDWGTSLRCTCAALGDRAHGLPRHRPPRAGHQHRVHRRCSCCGSGSSARSTSTPASTPTTT